ncbi:unnamed protein product [Prorocentrum cordatum]|uniref:Phospholipase B-like n=1 Tax=Prorocentrum cordatum TaxID=2364126 RepID=A0ABN9SNB7_9DINO|nr:unnamed protein product [Polarella glacialis]
MLARALAVWALMASAVLASAAASSVARDPVCAPAGRQADEDDVVDLDTQAVQLSAELLSSMSSEMLSGLSAEAVQARISLYPDQVGAVSGVSNVKAAMSEEAVLSGLEEDWDRGDLGVQSDAPMAPGGRRDSGQSGVRVSGEALAPGARRLLPLLRQIHAVYHYLFGGQTGRARWGSDRALAAEADV